MMVMGVISSRTENVEVFREGKKGTASPRRSGGLGTPLDRLSLPGPDGDGDDECTVF